MSRSMCSLLATIALFACAVTNEQPLSDVEKASSSKFLTNYSLLKPGKEGEARLRYINPNIIWSSYTGIFLEPVVFLSNPASQIDAKEQQILATYYYNTL
jgi:hypothetical protein